MLTALDLRIIKRCEGGTIMMVDQRVSARNVHLTDYPDPSCPSTFDVPTAKKYFSVSMLPERVTVYIYSATPEHKLEHTETLTQQTEFEYFMCMIARTATRMPAPQPEFKPSQAPRSAPRSTESGQAPPSRDNNKSERPKRRKKHNQRIKA